MGEIVSTFHAFVLGMVQGITEFLPVSSSAHLVLVPWFFGWQDPGLAFDVFLHLGTVVAIFAYFARDWVNLGKAAIASIVERRIGYEKDRILFWFLFLGTIPAVFAGLLFHEHAETVFRSPLLIAVTLSVVGLLLYWIDSSYPALRRIEELKLRDVLLIGFAQALAIIPGVSRSGSTMAMARLLGMNREASARFSFLLSFPILLGAFVFEAKGFLEQASGSLSAGYVLMGFLSSLIFGFLSIHFLLYYLRVADFRVFAWYRLVLAGGIIIWSLV